jgi:hypothetical protein
MAAKPGFLRKNRRAYRMSFQMSRTRPMLPKYLPIQRRGATA